MYYYSRNCTTTLLKTVPVLASYEALKSQFDWLTDGSVSHLVEENLGRELSHLELYLRYFIWNIN